MRQPSRYFYAKVTRGPEIPHAAGKRGFFDLILCHCFLIFSFLFFCVLMNCVPKIMPISSREFSRIFTRIFFDFHNLICMLDARGNGK